jgi:CBS domain-containing protein
MSHAIPRVARYMSVCPLTIRQDQSLTHAHRLMREHNLRLLPVLHGDKVAGILSERDVRLCERLRGADPDDVWVREVMATDVYAVPRDAPLDEVVLEMAAHRYSSTVIVDHGKVVGVLTSFDALAAFSAVLADRFVSERGATS